MTPDGGYLSKQVGAPPQRSGAARHYAAILDGQPWMSGVKLID